MTARSPADVIRGALRVQGTPHPDIESQAVIAALTGHGYDIKLKPKTKTAPRRDCPHHPGTETPGGVCPSCGPTGD